MANVAAANLTVEQVVAIEEGRSKAARTRSFFASLAKRGGQYVVETGWVVPEADEDDAGASVGMPFAEQRKPLPWVGRKVVTGDPAEALAVYLAYKANDHSRGEKIGSVTR